MAKSLVLGNGSLLVCLDQFGQVKDFYYPHVGLENHVGRGLMHRLGVFVDGAMHWLDDGSWRITPRYQPETMVGSIEWRNEDLHLALHSTDVVYNERAVFLRKLSVHNLADRPREVRIMWNQQFAISELNYGDTAYFAPKEHAVIHYKGRRVFLVAARRHDKTPFDEYSVGLLGIEGKEGTWRDAEDGALSNNAIEHGRVDSVIRTVHTIAPQGVDEAEYWIAAGESFREVADMHADIMGRSPEHLIRTTTDFWKAWLNKRRFEFYGLAPSVVELFKKSLLIVRTHVDRDGGTIASGDSDILQYGRDTYSYVWPRDGAYIMLALMKAGYFDISERFYSFCNDALTDGGYLLHKYRPDGSLGSSWHPWVREGVPHLPIQEDETAVTLVTLWEHYAVTKNLEFVEGIYNSYIKKTADFLLQYRIKGSGLPNPSYDLWEERYGIATYTASSVYGALRAASKFAALLGKESHAKRYMQAAEKMRDAILKHLYIPETGAFAKMLYIENGALVRDETIDASAAYGVFHFGVLPPEDERLSRAVEITRKRLQNPHPQGGMARYEGDEYYRVPHTGAGNPWFIPTFWYLEYDIARARHEDELHAVREGLEWAVSHSQFAGMLAEQFDPQSGEPMSVCPLTWSHASFILAVISYLEKLEELGICTTCYPIGE